MPEADSLARGPKAGRELTIDMMTTYHPPISDPKEKNIPNDIQPFFSLSRKLHHTAILLRVSRGQIPHAYPSLVTMFSVRPWSEDKTRAPVANRQLGQHDLASL